MSSKQHIRVGGLRSGSPDDGVPEVLRDYGPRILSRHDLEAERLALVRTAYERKFGRIRQADPAMFEPRAVTWQDLLLPVEQLLAMLPRRNDCPEDVVTRLVQFWAKLILDAGSIPGWHDATGRLIAMERPAEAIAALERLAKLARKLGPLAEQSLHLTSELLNRRDDAFLAPPEFPLFISIEAAIDVLRPYVSKGARARGTAAPRGRRLADQVARAYGEITGELPPTTDPYGEPAREHPYHKLARQVFEHFRQDGWKDHSRAAARQLRKRGSVGSKVDLPSPKTADVASQ